MEVFVGGLVSRELPALARLVQVLGFKEAEYVLGHEVIGRFPSYAKFIKPMRRKQLETLWPLYSSKKS